MAGRSRATAFVSVGSMTQNDPLLPMTVNSTLPVVALERSTAEAEARVTAMNYNFTSRPTNTLWFSARYRQYEFDNRTPIVRDRQQRELRHCLHRRAQSRVASRSATRATRSMPTCRIRRLRYLGLRAGYTRDRIDRTYRIVEQTTEDIGARRPWISPASPG